MFPLLLLETMRDRDRPEEVLEEEDITTSLPRRLGLSEVVRLQIDRFQEEVKQRRPQFPSQVEDFVRLVIRRPDADAIFLDAGRRVARRYWEERRGGVRRTVHLLPRPVALVVAQRAARRMLGELNGPSQVRITRRPLALRIDHALTARADPSGAACEFYTGAFAELFELYTDHRYLVVHTSCAGGSGSAGCEWAVEIAS